MTADTEKFDPIIPYMFFIVIDCYDRGLLCPKKANKVETFVTF
jgi:hypothetical protein